ncbi:putative chromatin remodeling complex subunit (Arp9) [Aspergillus melleus]|nr:Actin-like protein arp9 (SWI/SNF complex component arp9) [Aspergillus melleus]KAH8433866.1 Actin-like protein arp9 (SWI/SNF complex component arp9) [Aspergillus melleus]
MPPFKDEHILIIAPGSQVTLAQLGLPESFTPARFRFPSRMFPAEKKGEYEPYKIRERRHEVKVGNGVDAPPKEDVEMKDAESAAPDAPAKTEAQTEAPEKPDGAEQQEGKTESEPAAGQDAEGETKQETAEQIYYEEDIMSDEGAVYPLRNGNIVDWPCFFALLTHIHNTLSPPFHTPIMLIAEPIWTARDREVITQFVFEKFKTPAFCLMDSALAICYGYGTSTATVVDVGKDKVDVTAVTDFLVNEHGRGNALEGCGGDYMTDRLLELLGSKGFTREMCEQLKRSNITEILPAGVPLPGAAATARQNINPGTTASAGNQGGNDAAPKGPGEGTQAGQEGNNEEDDEGVLDVAAIVSGNTSEFLANREKEKGDKSTNKKGQVDQAGKPLRLPNSKKEKATFQYEEFVRIEPEHNGASGPGKFIRQTRDIEVGVERFLSATPKQKTGDRFSSGILDDIATQIHHTILAVPDASKRSELWDSLIVVGNGSKVKGFTQSLLGAITQRFILSPSATIFTSELPSNFSTPLPTGGTNTPAPSGQPGPMHHPAGHGVNPLLVAATHSNNAAVAGMPPGTPSMDAAMASHYRSTGHSQTPTSVKTLKPPEYFPEWKEQSNTNAPGASGAGGMNNAPAAAGGPGNQPSLSGGHGMEEAVFLGAQVASKVIFVLDQGLSKGFMSRVEYNENGPSAIHEYIM